jgi:TPR repeat protein
MKKRIIYSYILLIVMIAVVPAAGAGQDDDLDAAVKAVEQQDFMTAYQLLKKLAEQGNAEAQYNLGILYRQGKGVMRDTKQAVQWFKKAADQGLATAQYYVGNAYDVGEGVEKNTELAVQWYQKAAKNGDPLAQTNLGVSYVRGEGIKQDIVLAYVWFSLAASQGLTAALENRNLLKQDMSDKLVKNAQRLTREYFKRYVAPFQPQNNKLERIGHPSFPNAHQTSKNPPRPTNAPALGSPVTSNHSGPHGHPPMD